MRYTLIFVLLLLTITMIGCGGTNGATKLVKTQEQFDSTDCSYFVEDVDVFNGEVKEVVTPTENKFTCSYKDGRQSKILIVKLVR